MFFPPVPVPNCLYGLFLKDPTILILAYHISQGHGFSPSPKWPYKTGGFFKNIPPPKHSVFVRFILAGKANQRPTILPQGNAEVQAGGHLRVHHHGGQGHPEEPSEGHRSGDAAWCVAFWDDGTTKGKLFWGQKFCKNIHSFFWLFCTSLHKKVLLKILLTTCHFVKLFFLYEKLSKIYPPSHTIRNALHFMYWKNLE